MKLTPEQVWVMANNVAAQITKTGNNVTDMSRDELAAIDSRCANLIENPSQYDGKDYDETETIDYFKVLVKFHMAVIKKEGEKSRPFSLQAGEPNSIFVWSSPFAKNFSDMPDVEEGMSVVITNAQHTYVHIYDTRGFSESEKLKVVKAHCRFVTQGCNYSYELIKKIGNCYFVN